ncbi:MAG: hypothetical protein A4E64_00352 [Syntrophorhabdus sp. PtaU1.Bin058]|nr:MAG: hypothetical protein A4E64_00352 [Syntrophorhabdus sp. PtaU1.Bin058]
MQKGFTLIEAVMAIVVLSVLSLFTFSFMISSSRTYGIVKTQGELYQEAAYVLERISRELRDGTYISAGSTANSITFQKVNYSQTYDNSLDVGFYQSGTDLLRSSTNNPNKPFGSNVTGFSIAANPVLPNTQENTVFTITVVVEDLNNPDTANRQKITLTTTVCPKNYCSAGPGSSSCTANYNGRSYNRDYDEVIQ